MSGLMCDGRTAAGGAVRSLRVEGFSEIFIGTDRGAERREREERRTIPKRSFCLYFTCSAPMCVGFVVP